MKSFLAKLKVTRLEAEIVKLKTTPDSYHEPTSMPKEISLFFRQAQSNTLRPTPNAEVSVADQDHVFCISAQAEELHICLQASQSKLRPCHLRIAEAGVLARELQTSLDESKGDLEVADRTIRELSVSVNETNAKDKLQETESYSTFEKWVSKLQMYLEEARKAHEPCSRKLADISAGVTTQKRMLAEKNGKLLEEIELMRPLRDIGILARQAW